MDTRKMKAAAEWFYRTVFKDEAIHPKSPQATQCLPSLLKTARSLENLDHQSWQSRESLFLKQGKLLANYEDSYDFQGSVQHYYTTYQSLTDQELRGYFSWRTKLRQGELKKTYPSFAFLYIYELLNQIGVLDPDDGFRLLYSFYESYGKLDSLIPTYMNRWLVDYVIYYNLDPTLLSGSVQVRFDNGITVLEHIQEREPDEVIAAIKALAPTWLGRSKFYAAHTVEMDAVIVRILGRVSGHYAARCKKTLTEQYFGVRCAEPVHLFDAAVFCDPLKRRDYTYTVDEQCVYRCTGGKWTVYKHSLPPRPSTKLDALLKTIDAVMRQEMNDPRPVKAEVETKWILKLIQEEIQAFLAEQQAARAKKIVIDYSQLTQIRQDAAVTQEKLIVEDELDLPEEPSPAAPPETPPETSDTPLSQAEYRLLQCLLYGGNTGWVQAEGHLMSVLVDGINEKLYDTFLDTVLDDTPQVMEDYAEDLKEMVRP